MIARLWYRHITLKAKSDRRDQPELIMAFAKTARRRSNRPD